MRIAICSTLSAAPWGGSEELWSHAAAVLLKQGHAVSIHYPYQSPPTSQLARLTTRGATIYTAPASRRKPILRGSIGRWVGNSDWNRHPIDRWIDEFKPDMMLASLSFHLDGVHFTDQFRLRGIPYCLLVQAASTNCFLQGRYWDPYRTAFSQAAACYFVSEQNLELMQMNLGMELPNAEIVDNPFCVDPATVPAWPPNSDRWKLACVGRIDFQSKAQDVLIQALARPRWRERPVEATFLGSDFGNEPQLKALIERHGLQEQVKLGGFVPRIEDVWREHHALALPSRNEGNALALIEAMFCGRVPIVTNVGRASTLIDEGVSGFVAPAATVDLYDEALERAWQRRNDWPAIGAAAAKAIRSRHSAQPAEDFAETLVERVRPRHDGFVKAGTRRETTLEANNGATSATRRIRGARKMRVGFFSTMTGMLWGGSEELWSRSAKVLLEQGHEVAINYAQRPEPVPRVVELQQLGADVFYRPARRWGRTITRLIERLPGRDTVIRMWLKRAAPEFVVASMGWHDDDLTIAHACHALGIPYAVLLQSASPYHWVDYRHLEGHRFAYANAAQCYFVSELNRDIIEANMGLDLSRAKIVDNPFNVRVDAAPKWPAKNSPWKLACVARLHFASKGQDLILQALRRPKWRSRDIEVTFFGHDGGSRTHVERSIALYGLERQAKLGGYVNDIAQIWSEHHGLILPSRYEGNPLALIEAMMCGRPAITTNVGRVDELIEDNETGFVAAAPVVDLVDDALERAWQRRNDWQAIGFRAAQAIRSRHSLTPAEDFADTVVADAAGLRPSLAKAA
jgi:glycosyltransferase involved in cell wall biosynthesis